MFSVLRDTKLPAFHSRYYIWPLPLLSHLVVCSERHWLSNRMELCHLSLSSTEKLNPRHSAPTRFLSKHQSCWKLKCFYPRSKWKVPHYRKVDSEPKHSRFIQAVHHPEQICGKSNITLADGVAEGKKSFLTSKTTAV